MSQHPSLKIKQAGSEQRSVLKRFEKIRTLHEKKLWGETTSIFHLPKVKTVKLKVKKGEAQGAKSATTAGASPATQKTAVATAAPAKKSTTIPTAGTTKPATGGKEAAKK